MADVNELIVEQYLKVVKKWFYVSDIPFVVPSNYSNIDVLAYDPATGEYYDIEVKYRSAYTIAAKNRQGEDVSKESVEWLVDQFAHYPARNEKIREYTNGKDAIKILVTTKQLFGKRESKREPLENAFVQSMAERGYRDSRIWYFDDIIPELYRHIDLSGRYNTELLQTIRMIKTYLGLEGQKEDAI